MIKVDDYEGRSKRTAWRTSWGEAYDELNWLKENDECNEVDVQVLADAPLLLEEVKRLREGIEQLYESIGTMETQGNIAIRKYRKEFVGVD